jgi:hypothetical protein
VKPRGAKRCLAAVLLLGVTSATSGAQGQVTKDKTPAVPSAPPLAAAAAQPKLPVTTEQALYLIRSTLLTLNDANRTGNYTVFRDLAGPDFQVRNNPADLAQIFTDLRLRKFDLFAVALLAPRLVAVPALQPDGMLHLVGTFPTRPKQINFDLLFQNSGGSMASRFKPPMPPFHRRSPRNKGGMNHRRREDSGMPPTLIRPLVARLLDGEGRQRIEHRRRQARSE